MLCDETFIEPLDTGIVLYTTKNIRNVLLRGKGIFATSTQILKSVSVCVPEHYFLGIF